MPRRHWIEGIGAGPEELTGPRPHSEGATPEAVALSGCGCCEPVVHPVVHWGMQLGWLRGDEIKFNAPHRRWSTCRNERWSGIVSGGFSPVRSTHRRKSPQWWQDHSCDCLFERVFERDLDLAAADPKGFGYLGRHVADIGKYHFAAGVDEPKFDSAISQAPCSDLADRDLIY